MNFAAIIKEIGRGARGARGLDFAAARESFAALLAGEVSAVALGAWWMAMRVKGETPDELAGFVDAMQSSRAFAVHAAGPLAVLPCYNGARQLPNLTPLLAVALARRGVRVLLHGVRADPGRVTTFELFAALGLPVAETALSAEQALAARGIAFLPIDVLHPSLAALLANRFRIGVRSAPHTVVKLLQPLATPGAAVRVLAVTHGDYIGRMAAHLAAQPGVRAVVFRGCEGEPVLHPKRAVPVQIFRNGETLMQQWAGVAVPNLPDTCDIAATAAMIEAVISGQRPLPPWIDWLAQQVHLAAYDNTPVPG